MSQGSAASLGLQDAPLSSAFRQAWQQWQQDWLQLPKDSEDEAALVETVVELSTQASQRLWRTAYSRVGDSATEQVKAVVYAFVALVDETLLFTPWPAGLMADKPLESRLYSSRRLASTCRRRFKPCSTSSNRPPAIWPTCICSA